MSAAGYIGLLVIAIPALVVLVAEVVAPLQVGRYDYHAEAHYLAVVGRVRR